MICIKPGKDLYLSIIRLKALGPKQVRKSPFRGKKKHTHSDLRLSLEKLKHHGIDLQMCCHSLGNLRDESETNVKPISFQCQTNVILMSNVRQYNDTNLVQEIRRQCNFAYLEEQYFVTLNFRKFQYYLELPSYKSVALFVCLLSCDIKI